GPGRASRPGAQAEVPAHPARSWPARRGRSRGAGCGWAWRGPPDSGQANKKSAKPHLGEGPADDRVEQRTGARGPIDGPGNLQHRAEAPLPGLVELVEEPLGTRKRLRPTGGTARLSRCGLV